MDIIRKIGKKENEYSGDSGIIVKNTKTNASFFEKISLYIFYSLLILLPIFVVPFSVAPLPAAKNIILNIGVLSLLFFWLLLRFQGGEIRVPKSFLFLGAAALILVWLVSSLFSGHIQLSVFGKLYDSDTFSAIASLVILMFLAAALLRTKQRVSNFYRFIFAAAFFVFIFQIVHVFLGVNLIPFDIFRAKNSNLIGGWSDFSIFFGFMALAVLILSATGNTGRRNKIVLNSVLVFSMLAMIISGTLFTWLIFGIFCALILVYSAARNSYSGINGEKTTGMKNFLTLPFVIFLIALFFTWDGSSMAGVSGWSRVLGNGGRVSNFINKTLGTTFIEVRPSWSTTADIISKSIKEKPVIGYGPNTFVYNWIKFKPQVLNLTAFWDARFNSGIGYVPTSFVTTGFLGAFAFTVLILSFFWYGRKVFARTKDGEENTDNVFLRTSFIGAAYLWVYEILYSPGIVLTALAFAVTGVVIAILSNQGKIKTIDFSFSRRNRFGLANAIITIILLIGCVSLIYMHTQRIFGFSSYNKALKIFNSTGDLDKTGQALEKARKLNKQDEYLRALSELNLIKLNKTISDTSLPKEEAVKNIENSVSAAVSYANEAAAFNREDPANWMQLGRIYESLLPLKIKDAENFALAAYSNAFKYSPMDPAPAMASARVAMQIGKPDEAKKYLEFSLNIKNNFVPALFLLSRLEAQAGNLNEAILRTEQAAALSPNDSGVLFQLGLLYYQAGKIDLARLAFERAVALDANYANARYFLGIIYDGLNMTEHALAQFENILANNPDNEEVKVILKNLREGRKAFSNMTSPVSEEEESRLENPKKK